MRRSSPVPILVLAAATLCCCSQTPPAGGTGDLLILISIDGFRWDYLEKHRAPNLGALAADGVRARRLTPCFPSKTFPNHYSLVTGLRPETHGIIGNWFYDAAGDEKFDMSKTETRWWEGGEPVWITAEKQGVRTGCFFWPGSESEIQGRRPALYRPFEKKLTCQQRVDGLLEWLRLPPSDRPRLFTLYFDLVDTVGHVSGPDAPETGAAVAEADSAVGRLLEGLATLGLREKTNLVVVSDHGMSPCGPDRVVFFEDLMDVSAVRIESDGPNGGVRPMPGTMPAAELAAAIRARAPPQVRVCLREETPPSLHYRNNARIPPVLLVCDDHWNVESKVGWPNRVLTYPRGSHGWDPATPNMGALFLAQGPAFRRGATIGDFENIHVYNLLCRLLGIQPARNEGDDRLARRALVQ